MQYLVDIEKEVIIFESELPAGHLLALKKIYGPKNYTFMEVNSMMDHFVKLKHDQVDKGMREQINKASTSSYSHFNIKDLEDALDTLTSSTSKKREFSFYGGKKAKEAFDKAFKEHMKEYINKPNTF